MAETFFTVGEGNPRAVTAIRRKADGTTQPLDQAVPDGDTVGVQLDGTGATRFLGIDTPEKAFEQPLGSGQALDGPKWEQYLTNPFANGYPVQLLEPPLVAHLQPRFGAGAAANHHRHAVAAGDSLRQLIQSDQVALGQTPEQFRYFLAFAYEVFDRYGRFLAFVNRNQPDADRARPAAAVLQRAAARRPAGRCRISSGRTSIRFATRRPSSTRSRCRGPRASSPSPAISRRRATRSSRRGPTGSAPSIRRIRCASKRSKSASSAAARCPSAP